MADLSKDDRLAELLTEMLIKQDKQEALLGKHEVLLGRMVTLIEDQGTSIKRTNQLMEMLTEVVVKQSTQLDRHTELLSDISDRLSDNGTHEVRIFHLEQSVYGGGRSPFHPSSPSPKPKGSKPTGSTKAKPKPKAKGK